MLNWILKVSIQNRGIVVLFTVVAIFLGIYALKQVPVDAIPDLSDTQVIIYSKWNVSPDILEDQVTYPIVTSLLGVPKVKDIRGISTFGASYVYVIFQPGTDIYWARSRVLEYLSKIIPQLPSEVQTELGPDATGVGWVYEYALKDTSGKRSLADLRSFQDWFLRYQLQSIPGVSEVASFGGFERQYQVLINPLKLRIYHVSISEVLHAIRTGNQEIGARVIEQAGFEFMVRLRGYAKSIQDIENMVLKTTKNGVPIYVKNIAKVVLGPEMRRGVGDLNGEGDTVGGVIVMRFGENAAKVIQRVQAKFKELKASLPKGLKIIETYNRSDLIQKSVQTLTHKLTIEIIIVSLVILIFLLHLPAAFLASITLPIAILLSFIGMKLFGVSANIMSLGGIAISIGAMVDASIVVIENVYKKLEHLKTHDTKTVLKTTQEAVLEVAPSSFYSLLVIAFSFLPIFALEAQEGMLFKPLAYTKTLTILCASVLSITLVPALLAFLFGSKPSTPPKNRLLRWGHAFLFPKIISERKHPLSKFLFYLYRPTLMFSLEHRKTILIFSILITLGSLPLLGKLGSEFMPQLQEGTILYMPTTLPGISILQAKNLLQRQDRILKSFPEVASVHGKSGRADTATDPAPLSMFETIIVLKSMDQWPFKKRWYSFLPSFLKAPFRLWKPEHKTWKELMTAFEKTMKFPGVTNAWTMPIKGRIDMLSTGMRTPIGIKILGSDLLKIQKIGKKIESILSKLPQTRSVYAERVSGGYYLDIHFRREALARHGISIQKAQREVSTALGGKRITTLFLGRDRYGVQVRFARAFRESIPQIEHIPLTSQKGYQVPLKEVALIQKVTGPGMIRDENGLLAGYVFIDPKTTDLGTYVENAKKALQKSLKVPPSYTLHWSGQYENMVRAKEKLSFLVPITIVLIAFLIYLNTQSIIATILILLSLPFAGVGAIWALFLLGYHISVAVWVGVIALLGIAAETAIYMLLYLNIAFKKRQKANQLHSYQDLEETIYEGALQRVRPQVMAAATIFFGLAPILIASASETGADVMKRLAAPMMGGLFSSFILDLVVFPVIFSIWKEKAIRKAKKKI